MALFMVADSLFRPALRQVAPEELLHREAEFKLCLPWVSEVLTCHSFGPKEVLLTGVQQMNVGHHGALLHIKVKHNA